MSTYIGLYCTTCNTGSGCGCKHTWKQELVGLLDMLPEMSALLKKSQGTLRIELDMLPWDDEDVIEFLCKHEGHTFELYNEYGEHDKLDICLTEDSTM